MKSQEVSGTADGCDLWSDAGSPEVSLLSSVICARSVSGIPSFFLINVIVWCTGADGYVLDNVGL